MKVFMVFAIVSLFFVAPLHAMHEPGIEMHDRAIDKKQPEQDTLVSLKEVKVQELRELLNNYTHIPKGTHIIWHTGNTMHYTVSSDDTNTVTQVRTVVIWRNNRECCGKATSIKVKRLTKLLNNHVQPDLVQITKTTEKSTCRRKWERRCCATVMAAALGGLGWMGYYLVHDKGVV